MSLEMQSKLKSLDTTVRILSERVNTLMAEMERLKTSANAPANLPKRETLTLKK